MQVIKLSEHSIKLLKKFDKFLNEREEELNKYLIVLVDLQDVVVHVDPLRLMKLLAGYPEMYLKVIRMKAGIASKLLIWEKEYDLWYADKYLASVKILEDTRKAETVDDGKGAKVSTGKILKDHITNYLKTSFYDGINQYIDTINELKVQLQMMEDIVRMFQNMNQAFKALADLREIWRPFVPADVYTGKNVQGDQTALETTDGSPQQPKETVSSSPVPIEEPPVASNEHQAPNEPQT